jgi:hypothetical protein
MIKYIMALLVIGIITYGGWFLYQDDTIEEVITTPLTFQEE